MNKKLFAQEIEGNEIVYQIITVFHGEELMPCGYWLQAKDANELLDFNVYIFNVQPRAQFDYFTGKATVDHDFVVN